MSRDVDDCDQFEERPDEPTEQDDREMVARGLRAIRGQIRRMGHSSVSCELMKEWQHRAQLLQGFRRADRASQVYRPLGSSRSMPAA